LRGDELQKGVRRKKGRERGEKNYEWGGEDVE